MDITVLNFIFGTFNVFWGIYNSKKMHSLSIVQSFSSNLIEKIFIPFYKNIECNLFVNVTSDNRKEIIRNLSELYNTLNNENLLFYISDSLLIPLEKLTQQNRKPLTSKEINKIYQDFSKNYYIELNRIRKTVGLKPRTPNFRVHHKLYRFKIQNFLVAYAEYIFVIAYLVIQLFLIFYSLFKK